MLNKDSKQWRRNFDLAHELFHLITWKARQNNTEEESFADHFASTLLMPENALRDTVETALTDDKKISYDKLNAIARQFNVSIDALCWRLHYVYNIPANMIKYTIDKTKAYANLPVRQSDTPPDLPSRYKSLAVTALKEGEISSHQFANYLGINVSDTHNYLIPGHSDDIQINTSSM
jgi:Zn-dependent peptidase ImmA (M78 family)